MTINLKLLQAFMHIAENRSFRKAAEVSNRSTSAVSMQLKSLEEQAGVALIRRTSHTVELTPEGEKLFAKARLALDEVNAGLEELRHAALVRRGLVTVASSPSIASTILPQVLVEFGNLNPSAIVRVNEHSADGMLKAVSDQAVDFGVGPVIQTQGDFNFTTILIDAICAVVPNDHPLAAKENLAFRTLRMYPCVTLSAFSALRRSIDDAAKNAEVDLNIQYEVQQIPTLLKMVSAGLGVGIAPQISLRPALVHGLKAISLVPALQRKMAIVTLKGTTLSAPALQLVQLLSRAAKKAQLD